MVKIGDRVQIYETCSNYYGRCGIVIGDDFCPTFPYKVEFEDGDDCIFKGKDLIVLSTEEETTMLFEVGDEVRVRQPTNLFHSELGKVVSIDHVKLMYKVIFHRGNSDVYTCFGLILVKRQEEKVMRFKVGDKVKVKDSWFGHDGDIGEIIGADDRYEFKYTVAFDDGFAEPFREEELELVKEEEKVMKFKVGDKVKVKDSWFGHDGDIGLIVRIDGYAKSPYRVKFDVVDEEDEEIFAEGSLELVKEKQSFTKSDLKTGMGVVLRDGSKGHVLLGTEAGDVIRFINGGSNQWASVDEYDENMIDYDTSAMDLIEVYSSRFAYACLTDRVFNQDCVFKREEPESEPKPEPEPTKMTMKEINEHFGKAIEIIE